MLDGLKVVNGQRWEDKETSHDLENNKQFVLLINKFERY